MTHVNFSQFFELPQVIQSLLLVRNLKVKEKIQDDRI